MISMVGGFAELLIRSDAIRSRAEDDDESDEDISPSEIRRS